METTLTKRQLEGKSGRTQAQARRIRMRELEKQMREYYSSHGSGCRTREWWEKKRRVTE